MYALSTLGEDRDVGFVEQNCSKWYEADLSLDAAFIFSHGG